MANNLIVRKIQGEARTELTIPLKDLLPIEERYRSSHTATKRMALLILTFVGTSWFFLLMMNGSTIGLVGMLFYIGIFITKKVRQKRAIEKNQDAVNLLNDMRYEDASQIFEELTESEQNTNSHPVYIFNRAVAYLLTGAYLRSFSLFNSVLKTDVFDGAGDYQTILLADMATALLLNNQLDEAQSYLRDASDRVVQEDRGYIVFAHALNGLKHGREEEVFSNILNDWHFAEVKLRLPFRRALSLLLAFAAYKSGRPEHIDAVLLQIHFSSDSLKEFQWVSRKWPEMDAFMRSRLQS